VSAADCVRFLPNLHIPVLGQVFGANSKRMERQIAVYYFILFYFILLANISNQLQFIHIKRTKDSGPAVDRSR
jgi:hypothetical protein